MPRTSRLPDRPIHGLTKEMFKEIQLGRIRLATIYLKSTGLGGDVHQSWWGLLVIRGVFEVLWIHWVTSKDRTLQKLGKKALYLLSVFPPPLWSCKPTLTESFFEVQRWIIWGKERNSYCDKNLFHFVLEERVAVDISLLVGPTIVTGRPTNGLGKGIS